MDKFVQMFSISPQSSRESSPARYADQRFRRKDMMTTSTQEVLVESFLWVPERDVVLFCQASGTIESGRAAGVRLGRSLVLYARGLGLS